MEGPLREMQSNNRITAAGIPIGGGAPPVLLAGPCVIEDRDLLFRIAEELVRVSSATGIPLFFKASFDKANRTSAASFRGPGLDRGLAMLEAVKSAFGIPVVTDIHLPEQAFLVADVADIIQIPAFLCRQTDLITAASEAAMEKSRAVNIKKGQFLAPHDMRYPAEKAAAAGCSSVLLTERGTTFGYNDLVVDFRGFRIMKEICPVIFDATHAVQQPGGAGSSSGGVRESIPDLVLAAAAAGTDGLFMEVHPDPASALSDAACMFPLDRLEPLVKRFVAVRNAAAEEAQDV